MLLKSDKVFKLTKGTLFEGQPPINRKPQAMNQGPFGLKTTTDVAVSSAAQKGPEVGSPPKKLSFGLAQTLATLKGEGGGGVY